MYCRNEELEPGWVAFGNGSLLHRPVSFDNKPHSLFQVIDQNTLQVNKTPRLCVLYSGDREVCDIIRRNNNTIYVVCQSGILLTVIVWMFCFFSNVLSFPT